MVTEVAKDPAFGSREAAGRAIGRIVWYGRDDHWRDWFNGGLPGIQPLANREKAVDTIAQVVDVMIQVGDLASDPVAGNPYLITNSEVLARLCAQATAGSEGIGAPTVSPI